MPSPREWGRTGVLVVHIFPHLGGLLPAPLAGAKDSNVVMRIGLADGDLALAGQISPGALQPRGSGRHKLPLETVIVELNPNGH